MGLARGGKRREREKGERERERRGREGREERKEKGKGGEKDLAPRKKILAPPLNVSSPCPVDRLCHFAAKSVHLFSKQCSQD